MKKITLVLCLTFLCFTKAEANQNNRRQCADSIIIAALDKVRSDSLLSYMQALQDFETRFMLAENRREVAMWIMEKFLSFGIIEVRLDSFQCYTGFGYDTITWQYNVEAKIAGNVYPDHEVIVMGHYDSYISSSSGNPMLIAPGADDNASGVAAALECARVLMEMEYQPAKTIIFLATAAEELMYSGDSGAKHYAQQAFTDNRKLGMLINNDMIAWNNGSWAVNIKLPDNSPHIESYAMYIIENFTSLNTIYGNLWTFADLEPFVQHGYHGIYFMENFTPQFYPYYHTVNDVVENLDTAYCAEITKISLGTVLHYDFITTDAALLGLMNIPKDNCSGSVSPLIKVANLGSDAITSMDIVCLVNSEEVLVYPWSGTIPFLDSALIQLPEISFALLSANQLEIQLDNINGQPDQFTGNNARSFTFGKAMVTGHEVRLRIRLDNNPHEITWWVKNSEGDIIYSGGPYTEPNTIVNVTMQFEEAGCYTFIINDSGGDGLAAPGHVLLFHGANIHILFATNFGSQAQTQFEVSNAMAAGEFGFPGRIVIYPNPVSSYSTIDLILNKTASFEAGVYNLTGQRVLELKPQHFEPGHYQIPLDTSGLKPGFYMLSVKLGDDELVRKIIMQ